MRNFLLWVGQIFQFKFWPHRRYCHVILGLQLLRRYDVISIFQDAAAVAQYYYRFRLCWCPNFVDINGQHISIYGWDITTSGLEKQTSTILEFYFLFRSRPFSHNLHFVLHQPANFCPNQNSYCANITSYRFIKMAAADAEYYFRFRICWYRCLQNVKVYEQTKFRRHNSIDGWDLTTSAFEKQTSAILEFYFWFWSRPIPEICTSFCITLPNFVQIGAPATEIWRHFHFLRWQPRPLNTSFGFVFVDVTVSEGQSLSPNQISSTYLNWRLRYNYFRFWKTNVRHIGILLLISISTSSP